VAVEIIDEDNLMLKPRPPPPPPPPPPSPEELFGVLHQTTPNAPPPPPPPQPSPPLPGAPPPRASPPVSSTSILSIAGSPVAVMGGAVLLVFLLLNGGFRGFGGLSDRVGATLHDGMGKRADGQTDETQATRISGALGERRAWRGDVRLSKKGAKGQGTKRGERANRSQRGTYKGEETAATKGARGSTLRSSEYMPCHQEGQGVSAYDAHDPDECDVAALQEDYTYHDGDESTVLVRRDDEAKAGPTEWV